MSTHRWLSHGHKISVERVPLDTGAQDSCPHFLPCRPKIARFLKIHELLPLTAPRLPRWAVRPVCTGPLSYTPLAPWPEIVSIKGNVTPDLFHAVPGAVCSVSGSTFTGLVLVSVKNPVFLSTEHSVSTWGRDLAQGPQEASSFSY